MIGIALKALSALMNQRTTEVAEYLLISPANWKISQDAVVSDPETARSIQDYESNLDRELDSREVLESKEEIKRIWLEKKSLRGTSWMG